MKYTITLLFLIVVFPMYAIENWLPYINNTSRTDYDAGTQNWMITKDNNGWIYSANNDGLLQFDGHSWNLFGNHAYRSIYHDNERRIYVGAFNSFGYFEPDDKGHLRYYSLSDRLEEQYKTFNDIWDIYSIDHIIYFVSYNHIFKLSNDEITVIESKERILASANIRGNLYVYKENQGVFLQTGQLFIPLSSTQKIANHLIAEILPYEDDKLILVTEYGGIYLYDNSTLTEIVTDIDTLVKNSQLYCASIYQDKLYIGTIKNGLIIIDPKDGQSQYYDIHSGLQNNSILSLFITQEGNAWLGLDNGISYIELNSPLSNLYTQSHNYGVGYTSIVFDRNIYFGTNQGLFYSTWPIPNIKNIKLKPVNNISGQVWSLTEINGQLFCGHNTGAYLIKKDKAEPITQQDGFWNFQQVSGQNNKIIAGTYTGLILLSNEGTSENPRWIYESRIEDLDLSCHYLEYDVNNQCWWAVHGTGYCKLELSKDLKRVERITKYVNNSITSKVYIFRDKDDVFFTTDKGVLRYDSKIQDFVSADNINKRLNTNSYLRVIKKDDYDRIWYTKSNNLRINYLEDGKYVTDSISLASLTNNMMVTFENINTVNKDVSIVSTLNGFSLYKTDASSNESHHSNNYKFSVRRIIVTAANEGTTKYYFDGLDNNVKSRLIIQKYSPENSYRFEMNPSILPNNNMSYYVQLEGINEQLLPLDNSGIKEYTDLKEGDYKFHILAQNNYTREIQRETIELKILPPWYRSIYAYIMYFVVFSILLYGAYRILDYFMQKQHQKRMEELRKEAYKREFKLKEEALERDKQIIELQNEKLQQDLKLKSHELSNSMFYILQKQEIFTFMKEELQKIASSLRKDNNDDALKKLYMLLQKVSSNIEDEGNWEKLQDNFNIVHNNFIFRLKEKYPTLTSNDLKLAAYIRMNLITKEVAPLFNISERGLESARYRLRKKLNLKREDSLSKFLQDF